jgi:plasmid stabilization system protein ParE
VVKQITFSAKCRSDVRAAYTWYETREPGLGGEFLRSVRASLALIRRRPELYPKIFHEYRRALLRRFPFGVIYEFSGDAVIVYAIFHHSRNPEEWQRRLPKY